MTEIKKSVNVLAADWTSQKKELVSQRINWRKLCESGFSRTQRRDNRDLLGGTH